MFISEKESQIQSHKKISLTLLPMLQFPSGLVSKTGKCEVVFSSQSMKDVFFDKL